MIEDFRIARSVSIQVNLPFSTIESEASPFILLIQIGTGELKREGSPFEDYCLILY